VSLAYPSSGLRIGYMTGQYPRATDTFIQREVAALRGRGVFVQTFSIRKPASKENVGPEQQAEGASTFYVLPARFSAALRAHFRLLLGKPRRYLLSLKTALTVRPAGLKALVWQAAYFVEAGVVADRVAALQLAHLHNHFSNSSCSVAMLAAQLGGFTFSFTMHGPAEFYEPKYWRIDEKIRRALFVACISNFCRSQAMVFAPRAFWEKLHIVHCGVNPADFDSGSDRTDAQAMRLLFVGRLAGVKGLPILLDAVARLRQSHPRLKLTVAGDGPDGEMLKDQSKRLGIEANVDFVGYQSQQQVRELLFNTDVFVMASFAEGVPVVLMEAMAARVPVVATQIAGVPELVENGVSGLLVPPGDAVALASKIDRLLHDKELRAELGRAGREKVSRDFNLHTEAEKLCEIFMASLAPAPPSAFPSPTSAPAHVERALGAA
jgi:colanic acid/amylovoran biosynthesis glycosyltransferase